MKELIKEDRIREEIVDAAQGLFKRYGLKKTSMEEIADCASKGKSTLYYYFKNKDDLFLSVLEKECASLREALKAAVNAEGGIKGKLKAYLNTKVREMAQYEVFHEFLRDMIIKRDKRFMEFMHTFEEFERELIKSSLEEARDQGHLRDDAAKDIDFTTHCIQRILNGLYMQMMLEGSFDEFGKNIPHIVEIILNGVMKES